LQKSNQDDDVLDVKEKKLYDSVYGALKLQVEESAMNRNNEELVVALLETFKRILKWKELYRLVPKYSVKPLVTSMVCVVDSEFHQDAVRNLILIGNVVDVDSKLGLISIRSFAFNDDTSNWNKIVRTW